jgi:Domain of unknown function (DUF4386)
MQTNLTRAGAAPLSGQGASRAPIGMARLAGLLYIIIAIAAIVAHSYVPAQLLVPGDAAATAEGIRANPALFRAAIGAELIVLVSEVALSILLYILLKPVSPALSLIAAAFRLVMTTIHATNLINSFMVLLLLSGGEALSALGAGQQSALVQLFLDAHHYGFTIGIVFLVPHVFLLGGLVIRSGYIPRTLGVLLIIAACGYLADSMALLFMPSYTTTPAIIALPIAIAEVAFPLWLLARGVSREGWGLRAAARGDS